MVADRIATEIHPRFSEHVTPTGWPRFRTGFSNLAHTRAGDVPPIWWHTAPQGEHGASQKYRELLHFLGHRRAVGRLFTRTAEPYCGEVSNILI